MERRLIPNTVQARFRVLSGAGLEAEIERVRQDMTTPLPWRLCPSFTSFYNPVGMSQAEIDAYDAAQLDKRCTEQFDGERMSNAIVWVLIDHINYPCTVTKFRNSRNKILEVFKAQPWIA